MKSLLKIVSMGGAYAHEGRVILSSHHGGIFIEVMLGNDGVAGFVKSWESGNEAKRSDSQQRCCVANVFLEKTW